MDQIIRCRTVIVDGEVKSVKLLFCCCWQWAVESAKDNLLNSIMLVEHLLKTTRDKPGLVTPCNIRPGRFARIECCWTIFTSFPALQRVHNPKGFDCLLRNIIFSMSFEWMQQWNPKPRSWIWNIPQTSTSGNLQKDCFSFL
jgi:hypothetical protein